MFIEEIKTINHALYLDETKNAIGLDMVLIDGTECVFPAMLSDCMAYGRELYQNAVNGLYGEIKAYTPPPPPSAEELEQQRITDNVANNAKIVKKETAIALEVNDDYRLGIDVTDEQMTAVRTYIKAIRSNEYKTGDKLINLDRPTVMNNYD